AMELDDHPHERETDAESRPLPRERTVSLHEHLEDARQERRRNADPAVAHAKDDRIAAPREAEPDETTRRAELDRVVEEMDDDLDETSEIALHAKPFRAETQPDLQALGVDQRLHHLERLLHDRRHLDRLAPDPEVPASEPGDVEHVLDHVAQRAQGDQPVRLARDHPMRARDRARVSGGHLHHLERDPDRIERLADVVREQRQEQIATAVRILAGCQRVADRIDVREGTDPADDGPSSITHRMHADDMQAGATARSLQAALRLEWLAGLQRTYPERLDRAAVVFVDRRLPPPARRQRRARILAPASVHPQRAPVGVAHPDHLWKRLRKALKLELAGMRGVRSDAASAPRRPGLRRLGAQPA